MFGATGVDKVMLGADLVWEGVTPGTIFAFAGDGSTSVPADGTLATSAGLNSPYGVAFDGTNNAVYISSLLWHRVYKVDLATERITRLVGTGVGSNGGDGGPATSAFLNQPWGLLCHGNKLYIACFGGHVIRVVDLATNIIDTFAGTGTGSHSGDGGAATSAMLRNPAGLAYADGKIYIADSSNNRIRSVDLSNNIIATFAGTGTASGGGDGGQALAAFLNSPRGVTHVDGKIYIADANNHKVRVVDLSSNIINTFVGTGVASSAGDDGTASNATVNAPGDVVDGGDGYLYIAESNGHRVRRVNLVSEIITTYAGTGVGSSGGDDGPATSAQLNVPMALAVGGRYLYIAETGGNRVRKVKL